ncbi:D-alanyl-D-alanine carboxypeptidase [Candidatus Uhrbacteria bacterium]|nr:D-alanyl-D-alanine carboxypeptidase [Candidatus Uhrbacteria bacterium]
MNNKRLRQIVGVAVGLLLIATLTQLRPLFVDATITKELDAPQAPQTPVSAAGSPRVTLESAPVVLPIPLPVSIERNLTARHAVVMDISSGRVVGQRQALTPYPMASLTKLLAALVLVDRVHDWEQLVEITSGDVREGEPVVRVGDRLELYDLFAVTLIRSSNTGIEAIARSVGLTRASLVQAMNEMAQLHGWTTVYITDPTGLAPTTVGSAEDISRILALALSRREIASALGAARYQWWTYSADNKPLKQYTTFSTNELIHPTASTEGYSVIGGKTGYIPESGYNVAVEAVSSQGARRMIAVVLGSSTFDRRFIEADELLRWAFTMNPAEQFSL